MSLISVNNLTFGYDGSYNNIFEDVSFNIDTDWKLGLIGRNGKGKTTFLKLLQGKLSYPTTIFMVEKINMVAPIPGYMTRETIQPYLFYFGEKVYDINNTWESFLKGFTVPRL